MKNLFAATVLAMCAMSASAQGQKQPETKPITERSTSQEAVKDRSTQKTEKASQGNADPYAKIGGEKQYNRTNPPTEEQERKMNEQEAMEKEKAKAMQQREEALMRSGQSAEARKRVETAVNAVDRSQLDKESVQTRHQSAQAQAKDAVIRLTQQCDELQQRMVELKNEVRSGIAAGKSDEELRPQYERIERMGQLLQTAQNELYFLKTFGTANETIKAGEAPKR